MQNHRRHTDAQLASERASCEGTRIDLAAFLALSSDARGARWRQWPIAAKRDVVIQQLARLGYDWSEALVAEQVAKYDAKWAIGPVEQAVEGALERLAFDNAQHAENADRAERAYFRRHATAYSNALAQYRAGVRPQLLASGAWLLPSSSGKPAHIVRMVAGDWECSCCAGRSMHWPIALVVGQEVAADDMQAFDDGAPESELAAAIERTNEVLAAMRLRDRICAARGRYAA
jgi:hypothetical protein